MSQFTLADTIDFPDIYRIKKGLIGSAAIHSKNDIYRAIRSKRIYILKNALELAGYIWIEPNPHQHTCYIEAIGVSTSHLHKDREFELLKNAIVWVIQNTYREALIHIDIKNKHFIELLKDIEFHKIDIDNDFYGEDKHAYLMRKTFHI